MQWGYVYRTRKMLHEIKFPIVFPHKCFSFLVSLDALNNFRIDSSEHDNSFLVHTYGQPSKTSGYVVFSDSDNGNMNEITSDNLLNENRMSSFSWLAIGY
jgi:hypothetical protein